MNTKAILVSGNNLWNPKARYKVNTVVSYLAVNWQNATGINTEPGTDNNWGRVSSFNGNSSVIDCTRTELIALLDVPTLDRQAQYRMFGSSQFPSFPIRMFGCAFGTDVQNNWLDTIAFLEGFQTPGGGAIDKGKYGIYDIYNDVFTSLGAPDIASDYANDTAAGVGGILVGEMYHTAGVVKIKLT